MSLFVKYIYENTEKATAFQIKANMFLLDFNIIKSLTLKRQLCVFMGLIKCIAMRNLRECTAPYLLDLRTYTGRIRIIYGPSIHVLIRIWNIANTQIPYIWITIY